MSGKGDDIMGGMSVYADRDLSTKEYTVFKYGRQRVPGKIKIGQRLRDWAKAELGSRHPVILQPHVKSPNTTCVNKDWGWGKWLELAWLAAGEFQFLQLDWGRQLLPGVDVIKTATFEHAAAVLSHSRGIVTTEGGMGHAAGALLKPAVVIFGGANPPSVLGYAFHANLYVDTPGCLGWRVPRQECRDAMDKITPEHVLDAMYRMFGRSAP